ncbi:hypothetical protein K488DRAFT_83912 [Vararia minispora EC-137]|uniref:Uncharacterized protein n=1 Tax=Vararia minispora EC-137 TaxID=1314806 RepID=A0ACB8QT10_9AGAM|nr:hypothetical protein K488DRAFT_83912 [Vararia minispora EC-137]
MPNTIPTGMYTLMNVRYSNIIMLPDNSDGTPVIASVKSGGGSNVWHIEEQGNGRYTLRNRGESTYAWVGNRQPLGATVVGRPSSQQFTIEETREPHKYTIGTSDTSHYWGLPDGEMGSAVELRASSTDKGNWWTFTRTY